MDERDDSLSLDSSLCDVGARLFERPADVAADCDRRGVGAAACGFIDDSWWQICVVVDKNGRIEEVEVARTEMSALPPSAVSLLTSLSADRTLEMLFGQLCRWEAARRPGLRGRGVMLLPVQVNADPDYQ